MMTENSSINGGLNLALMMLKRFAELLIVRMEILRELRICQTGGWLNQFEKVIRRHVEMHWKVLLFS